MLGVADIETNGFYDEATIIHCLVIKDVETGLIRKYVNEKHLNGLDSLKHLYLKDGLEYIQTLDKIIFHNGLDFDIRVIKKLYGVDIPVHKIIDTYLLSCMLRPDRRKPKGCKGGSHSLEAWGYRVGRGKPHHNDWENFSPEMLNRCQEDVEITELVAKQLGIL